MLDIIIKLAQELKREQQKRQSESNMAWADTPSESGQGSAVYRNSEEAGKK